MAKKKSKEVSLDDLEEKLDKVEKPEEEEEGKIKEIEEFGLEEAAKEGEVGEVFEEEVKELEKEIPPEEEIIDERIYIVPLSRARRGSKYKWAKKSVRYLRDFMERHFKPESLIISQEINQKIWSRGIQKPPRKIKVRATKNADGLVVVYLAE
jgi:large subunit ribosomal protein L31e